MDKSGEKLIIVDTVRCSSETTGVVGVDGVVSVMSELLESFRSKLGYTILKQVAAVINIWKESVGT